MTIGSDRTRSPRRAPADGTRSTGARTVGSSRTTPRPGGDRRPTGERPQAARSIRRAPATPRVPTTRPPIRRSAGPHGLEGAKSPRPGERRAAPGPARRTRSQASRPARTARVGGRRHVADQNRVLRVRRRRVRTLGVGFALALVALIGRLTYVQLFDGPSYAAYATSEIQLPVGLPALRGAIYDRTGQLLAISEPLQNVVADDFLIQDPAVVAGQIAALIHVAPATLARELAERSGYVIIARQVGSSTESKIAALALNGITFLPDPARVYPDQTLVEPLIGGVDADGAGDAAIETQYNALLAGKAGSEVIEQSAAGDGLPSAPQHVVAPAQGTGLVLTIDEPLQVEVTRDVTAAMLKTGARTGVAVIESVHTGAILAMVDLARVGKKILPAESNLAVTSVYEPGSVMKLATFSYSLQDHLITPKSMFTVPYELSVGGYTFQDADFHPTEKLSASQILAQSSNIGTIEVSRLLGPRRLSGALRTLGFGAYTGLNWPGESPGIVGTPATWSGSSLGSVPIGTGEAVTPMQILDAYTAVANDGVAVTPRLVAGTVTGRGAEKLTKVAAGRRVLKVSTVDELVPMLEDVVNQDGTAVCASIPGYTVAGKTGTAPQVNPNGLGTVKNDFNASFVGFVPAQAPQLSGIVWLNHPTPIFGGSVSAPVFAQVMSWALRHFDIPAPHGGSTQAESIPSTCDGQ